MILSILLNNKFQNLNYTENRQIQHQNQFSQIKHQWRPIRVNHCISSTNHKPGRCQGVEGGWVYEERQVLVQSSVPGWAMVWQECCMKYYYIFWPTQKYITWLFNLYCVLWHIFLSGQFSASTTKIDKNYCWTCIPPNFLLRINLQIQTCINLHINQNYMNHHQSHPIRQSNWKSVRISFAGVSYVYCGVSRHWEYRHRVRKYK